MQKPEITPNETGGKMDVIYSQYPPNFDIIVKAFPMAAKPGVVFAYGDRIYVPSGKPLTHALKVHEATHGIRQKEFGLDAWWQRYIEDDAFRYYEELVAHFSEYMAMIADNDNRPHRRRCIDFVAKKLAHPLYCCKGGKAKAKKDLKSMEIEYRQGKGTFETGAE